MCQSAIDSKSASCQHHAHLRHRISRIHTLDSSSRDRLFLRLFNHFVEGASSPLKYPVVFLQKIVDSRGSALRNVSIVGTKTCFFALNSKSVLNRIYRHSCALLLRASPI